MLPDIIIGDSVGCKVPLELVGERMTNRNRINERIVTGEVRGVHVIQHYRDGFCYKIQYLDPHKVRYPN